MLDDYRPILGIAILIGAIALRGGLARRKSATFNTMFREATAAVEAGDWPTAQARLEACIAHFPNASVARRLHGRALAQLGQIDRAEAELKMAVAFEPRVAEHQADLGLFYLRHNKPDEGIRCLEAAFALSPSLRETLKANAILLAALPEAQRQRLFGV